MSVFIKFHTDELLELQNQLKNLKGKMIDVNSSTIEVKRNIREKRELINESFLHVNETHKELARIISMMPRVDSVPIKGQESHFNFINTGDHHNALVTLSDKISKLR